MMTEVFLIWAVAAVTGSDAWGGADKVLLNDVDALTLYNGKMTTGRRSSPVPQLTCVGGSAAGAFIPQVVQCYNRGSDGIDVQWECKADMDNSYRFGRVEVVCEGYGYPDDPYILKGSCGLEYTLELTEEGRQKHNQGHSGGHHSNYHSNYDQSYHHGSQHHKGSGRKIFGDLIFLAVVAGVIYIIYKKCIATQVRSDDPPPPYEDQPRRDFHGNQQPPPYGNQQPPPYGFRSEYMPDNDSCSGAQTHSGAGNSGSHTNTAGTGGGFWTGAATGGLLGYLFGSRTNTHHRPSSGWGNRGAGWGSGWGSGWGTGNTWGSGWNSGHTQTAPRTGGGGGGSASSGSSGTRTASGFGGTRRR